MPGQWDDLMKLLIRLKPQHLVSWLLQEAIVQNRLSEEFKITMYADGLFLVTQDNLPFLVHIEFQSKSDMRMGERLRAYNTLASQEHDYLPVYSCVVYLRKNINVTTSPLIIKLPTGQEICRFHYGIIELSKLKAEELLQLGLAGVVPLAVLTKNGTQPEIVDTMVSRLIESKEPELLAILFALGGIAFPRGEAQEWFRKRFRMFHDLIRDTWVYEEFGQEYFEKGLSQGLEKGLSQGLEKGLSQGLEKGEIRGIRQGILAVVQVRFPGLGKIARAKVEQINSLPLLQDLLDRISQVQTIQEAEIELLELHNEKTQN